YAGRILRTRFPSSMWEMRRGGATDTGADGMIGRAVVPKELRTPSGLPDPKDPGMLEPAGPTAGGPSSPAVGMVLGILIGILNVIAIGLLGAAAFPLART